MAADVEAVAGSLFHLLQPSGLRAIAQLALAEAAATCGVDSGGGRLSMAAFFRLDRKARALSAVATDVWDTDGSKADDVSGGGGGGGGGGRWPATGAPALAQRLGLGLVGTAAFEQRVLLARRAGALRAYDGGADGEMLRDRAAMALPVHASAFTDGPAAPIAGVLLLVWQPGGAPSAQTVTALRVLIEWLRLSFERSGGLAALAPSGAGGGGRVGCGAARAFGDGRCGVGVGSAAGHELGGDARASWAGTGAQLGDAVDAFVAAGCGGGESGGAGVAGVGGGANGAASKERAKSRMRAQFAKMIAHKPSLIGRLPESPVGGASERASDQPLEREALGRALDDSQSATSAHVAEALAKGALETADPSASDAKAPAKSEARSNGGRRRVGADRAAARGVDKQPGSSLAPASEAHGDAVDAAPETARMAAAAAVSAAKLNEASLLAGSISAWPRVPRTPERAVEGAGGSAVRVTERARRAPASRAPAARHRAARAGPSGDNPAAHQREAGFAGARAAISKTAASKAEPDAASVPSAAAGDEPYALAPACAPVDNASSTLAPTSDLPGGGETAVLSLDERAYAGSPSSPDGIEPMRGQLNTLDERFDADGSRDDVLRRGGGSARAHAGSVDAAWPETVLDAALGAALEPAAMGAPRAEAAWGENGAGDARGVPGWAGAALGAAADDFEPALVMHGGVAGLAQPMIVAMPSHDMADEGARQ